jgi:hypothetical protein
VTNILTRAVEIVAMIWREVANSRLWLKARAQSDEDAAVRRSAVEALARGWGDDHATQEFLKTPLKV